MLTGSCMLFDLLDEVGTFGIRGLADRALPPGVVTISREKLFLVDVVTCPFARARNAG